MRIYQIVLLTLIAGTGLPIALHHQAYGGFDLDQIGIAFFLWLNAIIALWEIALFFRIDFIEGQYARFRQQYAGRELDRVKDFFATKVPLDKILSPTTWAEIWSSYALFDDSYANRRSFGFFIDIGNGFSTLVPTLLCLYGMTYPLLPARLLGIVLLLLNYQMWYGTLVYFTSYVFNRRYAGHSRGNVALFVGVSNGLWFTFPLWAMYVAIVLIYADSYAVLRP